MRYAYIKDKFVDKDQPIISVEERGFRFGDGVFETIRIHDGILYQWELHLERLESGLEALKIPFDTEPLHALSAELIYMNNIPDGILRLSISRGIGSKGYLPTASITPTLVIETIEILGLPRGAVSCWTSQVEKISPRALPVNNKLMQGMNSILARMEAQEHECFDALQCNAAGEIVETSSGNIFWVKDNILHTPSLSCGAVAGTTRAAIIRLSPLKVKEGRFPLAELEKAEAVFITNVSWGAQPVGSLQPQGWQWNSLEAVRPYRTLLQDDIEAYVNAHAAVE